MFVFHFSFVKANNVGLWRLGMKNPRNSPQARRYARLVAPIVERIDSGCASISMRVLIRLTAPYNLIRICMVSAVGVAYLRPIDMADQFRIYALDVSTCGHGNAVQLDLLRGAKNFW